MNNARRVFYAKVNLVIGSLFVFSFGLFILTIGFSVAHMINPIEDMLMAQTNQALR